MDIPHAHRAAARPGMMALPTPQIYIHNSNSSDRFRTSSRSSSYNSAIHSPTTSSIPVSIPNSREPGPPPPLPPPRHLQDIVDGGKSGPDLAWKFGNSHEYSDWSGSVSSVATGSSLYGSFMGRRKDERADRGGSLIRSIDFKENSYPRSDEGYASQSGTSIGSNMSKYQDSISPVAGFQSSVHDKYRSNNAQAYDKSLLQKLDARRGTDNSTPPGYSKPRFSSSANDASPTSRRPLEHRQPSQLKPLSLPILTGRPSLVESPLSRWAATDTPVSGTSPGGNPYYKFGNQGPLDHQSPSDTAESDRSPLPYTRRSGSGSVQDDASSITSRSREGYDQRVSPDHDVDFHMEESGFTRLQIDDYSTRSDANSPGAMTGQKRRASSPPGDDGPSLHTVGSASDLFRRRESASRASPSPRFHSTSGSVSSTASGPRTNSYASSLVVTERSSTASVGSYGKLSPGSISTGNMDLMEMPYNASNSSPRASIPRTHQRTLSETRPLLTSRKMSDSTGQSKHNTAPKMQGVFMCECCPKKPKKFDSQEELNAHEQEKQYQCAYCCNRFKNKNEAERHQNSLHLRRHSWSCAALSGYAAAFHNSPNRPNESDTCGYCGEDFPRSGISSPSILGPPTAAATDRDWELRIGHLQEMHKFGECNHAKKFFRADHFRQHLKHSHAGTSGKWTNMLENACMKDEPLPEPIRGPERVSPGGIRVSRISEEEEM